MAKGKKKEFHSNTEVVKMCLYLKQMHEFSIIQPREKDSGEDHKLCAQPSTPSSSLQVFCFFSSLEPWNLNYSAK